MKLCIKITLIILFGFGFQFAQNNNILSNISSIKNSFLHPGMELEFGYTADYYSNLSGGLKKNSTYLDNIDVILNSDLEQLIGWDGASLSFYVLGNNGGIPSENSGAGQGISNIAAHDTWKIYEFWIEQNLFEDKLSLLLGLYDINSEFDTRVTSSLFINPSHGIGPDFSMTGKNGPSIFPTTSLTLRLKYNFSENIYLQSAILDGVPGNPDNPNGTQISFDGDDGLLIAAELLYSNSNNNFGEEYFKYSFGGWYYTAEFEDLVSVTEVGNSITRNGNWGIYFSAEKFLTAELNDESQGLSAFLRLGFADKNVNHFENYFGAGISYTGLIPGRDADVFGIALASGRNSDKFRNLEFAENGHFIESRETIIEFTYAMNLFDGIIIQPDLQYVINPVGCHQHNNALAFGTRFQLVL